MKYLHPLILHRWKSVLYIYIYAEWLNYALFFSRIAVLRWKFQLSRRAFPKFHSFLYRKSAACSQSVPSKSLKSIGTFRSMTFVPRAEASWIAEIHGGNTVEVMIREKVGRYSQFERGNTLVPLSRRVVLASPSALRASRALTPDFFATPTCPKNGVRLLLLP